MNIDQLIIISVHSFEQAQYSGNEPVEVILAGIVHKDEVRPAVDRIIEDIDQQISDVSHHVTELGIRLKGNVHLEDKSEEEVGIDTCVYIVQIEWHFDDVNNRFLTSNHPSSRKDHIRFFTLAQCLGLLCLQEIVDNEVSPWIDLISTSILIFREGSVGVFEYFLVKLIELEVMLLPKIVVR